MFILHISHVKFGLINAFLKIDHKFSWFLITFWFYFLLLVFDSVCIVFTHWWKWRGYSGSGSVDHPNRSLHRYVLPHDEFIVAISEEIFSEFHAITIMGDHKDTVMTIDRILVIIDE